MSQNEGAPRWSVVLPVYNQGDHLERVVTDHIRALDSAALGSFELILVPNGCRDDSEEICATLAATDDRVHVVPSNAGWGAAVRTGLTAARGHHLCYTNLARTTGTDLVALLRESDANPRTVVKANREVRDSRRRRIGSEIYTREAQLLGLPRV